MASAKQLSGNLLCPVCYDQFDKPRLLPCSHSFCHSCLDQLHCSEHRHNRIQCPVCRQMNVVPGNKVSNFPVNLIVKSLADDLKKGSEKKKRGKNSRGQSCTVCDADDQGVAVAYCQNCSEFLCEDCLQQHNKYKQNAFHELVNATDIRTGIVKMQMTCPTHPRELQEYVCLRCMERICCRCFEVEHNEHEILEIAEYEEGQKVAFQILQQKIDKKSVNIQRYVSYVDEKQREVRVIVGQRKQEIEKFCDVAIGQLQRRKYELLAICDKHEEKWCQELEDINNSYHASFKTLTGKASLVNEMINKLHQSDQSLTEQAAQLNGLETILQFRSPLHLLPKAATISQEAGSLTFQRAPETNALHLGTVHLAGDSIPEPQGAEASSTSTTQNEEAFFHPRKEAITLRFAKKEMVENELADNDLVENELAKNDLLEPHIESQSPTYDREPRLGLFWGLLRRMLRRSPDLS